MSAAYNALIADLRGTVYTGDTKKVLRPGASEFFGYLFEKEIPVVFGTNKASESKLELVASLMDEGLVIPQDKIINCVDVCISYLIVERLRVIHLLTGNDNIRDQFRTNSKIKVRDRYERGTEVDAVVLGFDAGMHHDRLSDAVRYIVKGARLVALHDEPTRGRGEDLEVSIGAYLRALVAAGSVTEYYVMGKPKRTFYRAAFDLLGLGECDADKSGKVLVLGDNPRVDCKGGRDAGHPVAWFPEDTTEKWPYELGPDPNIVVNESLMELLPFFKKDTA